MAARTEQAPQAFVDANVYLCQSGIVRVLSDGADGIRPQARFGELKDLAVQARALCQPVDDYEEAGRHAGWKTADLTPCMFVNAGRIDEGTGQCAAFEAPAEAGDPWAALCQAEGLKPYKWEVFEHWAVSSWLLERLRAHGERVDDDFQSLCIWGRICTGSAISGDGVICRIYDEMMQGREAASA